MKAKHSTLYCPERCISENVPTLNGESREGSKTNCKDNSYRHGNVVDSLNVLGEKMRAKVRPDESGDRSIIGKLGDIVEGTLNGVHGYYMSVMYDSARKLHEVLKTFRYAQVTQEGDSEAVIFLSHDNAMSRAEDLRVAINARKRPNLTGEQRQQKAARVLQVRPNPDHWVGLAA